MKKDFDTWNIIKKSLNDKVSTVHYEEREIWWCSLGANVGSEQDGKHELYERPVLVFVKFNQDMFWAMPMTSNIKNDRFHAGVSFKDKKVSVILSQLKLVSSKRLLRRMGVVGGEEYAAVQEKIVRLIYKNETPPLGGESRVAEANSGFIITPW